MSVLAGQSRTSGFGQLRVVIVCETGGGGQGQLLFAGAKKTSRPRFRPRRRR